MELDLSPPSAGFFFARTHSRLHLRLRRLIMQFVYIWYCKDKLDAYAVAQHNGLVSSNSPQKELDLSPPLLRAFFCPAFR
jgi:hypothetical protein